MVVIVATEVMTAMVMADMEVMAAMEMDIAAMAATAMGIAMEMDTAGVTDVALMSILLLPMLIPLPTAPFIALPQLLSTALHLPPPTGMLRLLTPMP